MAWIHGLNIENSIIRNHFLKTKMPGKQTMSTNYERWKMTHETYLIKYQMSYCINRMLQNANINKM